MSKKLLGFATSFLGLFLFATGVFAAIGYTFVGEADYVMPGHNSLRGVKLVSDDDPLFGAIRFTSPLGMKFSELTNLSTDFNVTDDDCGGGAPRFSLGIDTDGDGARNGSIFVYLGPYPNYTGCTEDTWVNSGDLLESGNFVDATQVGGAFYNDYDDAVADFGNFDVVSIALVTDGSWSAAATGGDEEQTIWVDNVVINDTVYDFEPTDQENKESCKNGGWESYDGEDGLPGPFKNQGQCISHFISEGNI